MAPLQPGLDKNPLSMSDHQWNFHCYIFSLLVQIWLGTCITASDAKNPFQSFILGIPILKCFHIFKGNLILLPSPDQLYTAG